MKGKEKPGIINSLGQMLDVSAFGEDYGEVFFENNGLGRLKEWLAKNGSSCPVINEAERLGPPLHKPSKIVCVGLNYAQHAKESGMELPKEPVLFFKATSSISGPNDDLIIPRNSKKTDYEVELAVVIEKKASYVKEKDSMDIVAGYVLLNDYSEREFQLERSGQWVKGKSNDTFAPLGPFLATKDEINDPHNLNLWLKLNGKMMQNSTTADLVFKIPFLVSYISHFMTLLPGDVVSTETPFGVGLGLNPPQYIKHGDIIELGVEGLGSARQKAKAYESLA